MVNYVRLFSFIKRRYHRIWHYFLWAWWDAWIGRWNWNPKWQASWQGKKIFDQGGQPALRVIKGAVNLNSADAVYQIDGLAGASLTSNGVSNLIMFWVGEDGFGPYLEKLRLQSSQLQQANSNRDDSFKKISSSVILRTNNQTGQG